MSKNVIIKTGKTVTEYHPKYCKKLIDHMRQGHSLKSFYGRYSIPKRLVDKWIEEVPEFQEAMEIAESNNLYALEEMALGQANGDIKGSTGTLKLLMTSLHGDTYKDKQVVENEGNVVFQIDTGINNEDPKQIEEQEDIEDVEYKELEEEEEDLL